MKKRELLNRCAAALLALSMLPALAACGEDTAKAATMHLKRTEGSVAVSDSVGADVPLLEDLGLYSGYGVDTRSESYAWINLDDVKLTKMDQESEIAITQSGKDLEIEVKSGALFFNVTEPLADDETMSIRTSTMLVGIRGTCGWVTDDSAALLEGTDTVTAGDKTATVNAGEKAVLTEDGELLVTELTTKDIPAFVREEIENDGDLAAAVPDDSGDDPTGEDPLAPYANLLAQYFDEVLYTEFVDFAGDGTPELLAIGLTSKEPDVTTGLTGRYVEVRAFPDPVENPDCNLYLQDTLPIFSEDYPTDVECTWSLVEADGSLFTELRYKYLDVYDYEVVRYSSLDSDGKWYGELVERKLDEDMGIYDYHYNYWAEIDSRVDNTRRESDAGEFETVQAKYSNERVLMYSPDGKSVPAVVTSAPDYEYDAQGQLSRINVYKESGELDYYYLIFYTTPASGGLWVDVESYYPDGSMDGWDSYNSLEEFYAAYADLLPAGMADN